MEIQEIKKSTEDILKAQKEYRDLADKNKQDCKSLREALKKQSDRNFLLEDKFKKLEKELDDSTDKIKTLEARYEARKSFETTEGLSKLIYLAGFKKEKGGPESSFELAKSIIEDPHGEEYSKAFNEMVNARGQIAQQKQALKFAEVTEKIKNDTSTKDSESFVKKSLNTVQESGAYLAPPQMFLDIQKQLRETSPLREVAEQKMISRDSSIHYVENEIPEAQWGDMQVESFQETKNLTYSKVEIVTKELNAQPRVSQNQLDDSFFDVESEIKNRLGYSFELAENKAFIRGTGDPSQPRGLNYYASRGEEAPSLNEPQKIIVLSKSNASLIADDSRPLLDAVSEMESSIISGWKRRGAVWLMHRKLKHTFRIIKDANGQYLLSQLPGWGGFKGLPKIQDGRDGMMLNYGILECDDMDSDISAGKYPLFFGNFRNYCIVDRVGIRMLIDPYTTNNTDLKFKTTKRVGAGLLLGQSICALSVT